MVEQALFNISTCRDRNHVTLKITKKLQQETVMNLSQECHTHSQLPHGENINTWL